MATASYTTTTSTASTATAKTTAATVSTTSTVSSTATAKTTTASYTTTTSWSLEINADWQTTTSVSARSTQATTTAGDTVRRLYYQIRDKDTGAISSIPPNSLVTGDVTREHTALGTHQVDVKPTPDSVNDLLFGETRLWLGGELLFRGELLKNSRDRKTADATLEGEDIGRRLKKDAAAVAYSNTPYYRAVKDYADTYTGFDWRVITPSPTTQSNDSRVEDTTLPNTDFGDLTTLDTNDPVYLDVASDTIKLAQTCFTTEGENATRESSSPAPVTLNDNDVAGEEYSSNEAIQLQDEGSWVEYDFTLDYTLETSNQALKILDHIFLDGTSQFDGVVEFSLNGTKIGEIDTQESSSTALAWSDRDSVDSVELASGDTHTLRIELTTDRNNNNASYVADVVAPYDSRYSYNFATSLDANDALAGPELYPDAYSFQLDEYQAARNIESARLDTSMNDTTGTQRYGLRPNRDDGYVYVDNDADPSVDFSASANDLYGQVLQVESRLGRFGSQSTTPTSGVSGQEIQDYKLYVTTNDLGVIGGREVFEGSHLENLQKMHESGGLRWSMRYRKNSLPVTSFEPGDETESKTWTTLNTSVGRDVYDYWNSVVVVGRRRSQGRLKVERRDDAEIQSFGEEVKRKEVRSEITDDEAELTREAVSLLNEGLSGDKFDGTVDIMAQSLRPGVRYNGLSDFDGRDVDLESVDYTISAGDVSGSLTFGRAQNTLETAPEIQRVKRDEVDTRRSIGDDYDFTAGAQNEITEENPEGDGWFEVEITGTNSPVDEGSSLDVDVTVTNTGDSQTTQDVELIVDDTVRDTQSNVQLAADGGSTSFTLSWSTGTGDAGDYTAYVESNDTADNVDVTIDEAASGDFSVSITSTNNPVEEGSRLDVTAAITNNTGSEETGRVTLTTASTIRDSIIVTIASGDTESITLSWSTESGDAGSYTATVSSGTDSDSQIVDVYAEGTTLKSQSFSDASLTGNTSETPPEEITLNTDEAIVIEGYVDLTHVDTDGCNAEVACTRTGTTISDVAHDTDSSQSRYRMSGGAIGAGAITSEQGPGESYMVHSRLELGPNDSTLYIDATQELQENFTGYAGNTFTLEYKIENSENTASASFTDWQIYSKP